MRRAGAAAAFAVLLALLAAVASTGPTASAARARLVHAPLALGAPDESSTNWAGYAVMSPDATTTPMSFTSVTGTWTQVAAACGTGDANAASAVWVGLGGYSTTSQALEQIGTDADCSPSDTPSYYAWYEIVPDPPVNLPLKINPGDTITTSVNVSGSTVLLQLKDHTRHVTFTKSLTASLLDLTSAEWIAEAPAECSSNTACKQLALTDFGSVSFARTYAVGNDADGTITGPGWSATAIQLVPHAQRFYGASNQSTSGTPGAGAMPYGLTANGTGFTITWQANASTAAPTAA